MWIVPAPDEQPREVQSEEGVSSLVRLAASRAGWRLFRNNVGAAQDSTGRVIRYGLANDSTRMNKALKSSDQIGIRPRLIGPQDIGTIIGQFVSLECKRAEWKYSGNEHERAQLNWILLIQSLGGYARFTTGGIE